MSLLQMFACEGCGATAEPRRCSVDKIMGFANPPDEWLVVTGPATRAEAKALADPGAKPPKRHACSPACLVDVAARLAELPNAITPAGQVTP